MSSAISHPVSAPRWMLWTGRIFSFLPIAILLSSAWVRLELMYFLTSIRVFMVRLLLQRRRVGRARCDSARYPSLSGFTTA